LLTGRRGRLAAVAVAVALVPAVAGAGVRAAAAVRGGQAVAAGVMSTVAGGVGGPARARRVGLLSACGVAFGAGFLYIGDGRAVRRVSPGNDWLRTPAGTGSAGPLGNGGLAVRAALNGACGAAVDPAGNLVIADTRNERVRVVAVKTGSFYGRAMTAGDIYTVAGDGTKGFSGDGAPATAAELNNPAGVVVDGAGNLVIADSANDRVRVVAASTGAFYGQAMTAGDIYTVAGDGSFGFSGDGGPATSAELSFPGGVAVDGAGNLIIADFLNQRIRVVAVKTGSFYGRAMTAGDIYTVAGDGTKGFSGDGGPATSAELNGPEGVAVDGAGNLIIADTDNERVRVVAAATGTFYGHAMTAGHIYTVAGDGTFGFSGDGGPATSAELNFPDGVAVDGAGNLVIADQSNNRIRVVAAATGTFYGQAMTAGDIYTVAGESNAHFCGDGGPAARAQLKGPEGVAVDGAGNLMIADSGNNRVRVAAAATGTFYGQAMTAGDIYTAAGDGTGGFSGDGGPATSAELYAPTAVAVDGAGNLVIAAAGNERVRVVAAATGSFYGQAMTAGDIYTVAGDGFRGYSGDGGPATSAELAGPFGVAVDGAGNLVIADTFNKRVRVVAAATGTFYGQAMTAGDIYTAAGDGNDGFSGDGGPATSAELSFPGGVAVDGAGNLMIADTANKRVRVVAVKTGTFYGQAMTAGDIYTVAGDGTGGFSGDGGPATSAQLQSPAGVAVDGAGNLVIADTDNNRVRVVAVKTGTVYGQAMTAGDIYTVAGDGTGGFSGDGGPATSAQLQSPAGVAVDGAGDLIIADTANNRVRVVAG
jgi:secreted PhoX family phosphatase